MWSEFVLSEKKAETEKRNGEEIKKKKKTYTKRIHVDPANIYGRW